MLVEGGVDLYLCVRLRGDEDLLAALGLMHASMSAHHHHHHRVVCLYQPQNLTLSMRQTTEKRRGAPTT